MPNCKNCGTRITRFDKDICPVCGYKKPLDGVESETIELTMADIDLSKENFKDYRPRKKSTFIVLWLLFGIFGIHLFYAKFIKYAFGWLGANLLIGLGSFSMVNLLFGQELWISILIAVGVLYLFNFISFGVFMHKLSYSKDHDGNLLK